MTQYYSRKDYEYAGDSNFTIPFSYIDKDDINVYVNEEKITTWTWLNDSQINISSTLTTGDIVSIRRNTPIDEKIVTYQNMSMVLNDDNLNLSQDQILNAVQEMYDNNVTFEIQVEGDIGTIEETANTALSNSQTAITTANSADSKADTAVSTANTASSNASTALSNSQTALNNSQSAVNTANSASETATTASNKVDAFEEDIASVISAAEKINELEEAVQTATSAATTASNKADIASNKATEATNAANRAEAVIPSQTGQNGKFLKTDGTSTSWETVDLSSKQDVLVSGTNIKTVNNNSLLGSGNIDIDALPSQTGNANKFLTTDGSAASWADVPMRNIGEIVESLIPLTDSGLHLLDGTLINGNGSYADFVDYIANLYNNTTAKQDNVTNKGGVILNNHVASGFSLSPHKFLQPHDYFTPESTDSWECVMDFTTGNSFSAIQYLMATGQLGSPNYYGFGLYIATTGKLTMTIGQGTGSGTYTTRESTTTLSTNTHYKAKVTCNGNGTYSLYLKSDSLPDFSFENSVSGITMALSDTYNYKPLIGLYYVLDTNTYYYPFLGSIDLSGCYIKVNDNIWWEGTSKAGFIDEAGWQGCVSTYGVCGKFVYDSVNNTVRLPKITGFIEGTTDVTALLDLTEAGLPNITGTLHQYVGYGGTASGAFYNHSTLTNRAATGPGSAWSYYVDYMDASRSSSIYGNSDTVQPQTIKVLYYIVIANSIKTDIQVDIDEIATDLNGKADVDLTNINAIGKNKVVTLAHELDFASAFTVSTTNSSTAASYQCPDDGCLFGDAFTTNTSAASLQVLLNLNNYEVGTVWNNYSTYLHERRLLPVVKGQSVIYTIYANGGTNKSASLTFIPYKKA